MKKLLLFLTLGLASLAAQVIPQGSFVGGGQVTPASPSGGSATFSDIKVGDGTVGAPSFSYILDTDTGFYRRGSGDVGFSSNGTNTFSFPTSVGSSGQFLTTDGAGNITWGTGSGVLPSQTGNAGRLLTTDGTNAAWADVTSAIVSDAPRQGVVSSGVSAVGYTADNATLAFGTGDLSMGIWVKKADWTPSAIRTLISKNAANLGFRFTLVAPNGTLRIMLGTGSAMTSYTTTAPVPVSDGDWAFVALTLDRDGNAGFYINGVLLENVSIAAQSAQTLTNAGALYIGSDGATAYSGVYGESFIVNGLLTAAQIATIAKAGTAVGLGLTMYQHLVPTNSLAAGIFEDVSGNNNHAALGSTGISTVLPVSLPASPVGQALVSDGSNGAMIRSSLNSQAITDGDFTVWFDATDYKTPTTPASLFALTDSYADVFRPYSLWVREGGSSNTGLLVRLFGSGTGNYDQWTAPDSVIHNLEGLRAALAFTRSNGTLTVYLCTTAGVFNITNLGMFVNSGSPMGWGGSINGDYLVAEGRNPSTASSSHSLYGLELLNTAPTITDFEYRVRNGRWHPKFAKGSQTTLVPVSRGYSYGADDANNTTGANIANLTLSVEAATRTGGAGSFTIKGTASGTESVTRRLSLDAPGLTSLPLGTAVRVKAWIRSNTTGWGVVANTTFNSDWSTTGSLPGQVGDENWQQVEGVFYLGAPSSGSLVDRIAFTRGSAIISGGYIEVDDVEVQIVGVTTALDTQDGGGFQPKNPRSENGSTNWEMSTGGVTWASLATAGKQISITKSYTHNQISTTAGTTLHGSLPAGWAVRETQVMVTATGDAGTTLNVGGAGTPAKYASAINIETMAFLRAESLSLVPESAVSVNGIYLQKNQATTQGAITVTVILERIY